MSRFGEVIPPISEIVSPSFLQSDSVGAPRTGALTSNLLSSQDTKRKLYAGPYADILKGGGSFSSFSLPFLSFPSLSLPSPYISLGAEPPAEIDFGAF